MSTNTPVRKAPQLTKQQLQTIVGCIVVTFIVGLLIFFQSQSSSPTSMPIATSLPVNRAENVAAGALTVPTSVPTVAPETHIVSAYAAPGGVVLGPVDLAGEAVLAVAKAGDAWVQLQRPNGDKVWARRAELPSNLIVAATLPDLSPKPQTGQGLTLKTNNDNEVAPNYIENVGAQTPHCIRTCGDGTWAAKVPTISAEQAAVIGAQKPHKIR
jgi:hypothetical protein